MYQNISTKNVHLKWNTNNSAFLAVIFASEFSNWACYLNVCFRGEGELELLYRNYCVRLQHSLFLGCLGVAAAFACLLLAALLLSGQVRQSATPFPRALFSPPMEGCKKIPYDPFVERYPTSTHCWSSWRKSKKLKWGYATCVAFRSRRLHKTYNFVRREWILSKSLNG